MSIYDLIQSVWSESPPHSLIMRGFVVILLALVNLSASQAINITVQPGEAELNPIKEGSTYLVNYTLACSDPAKDLTNYTIRVILLNHHQAVIAGDMLQTLSGDCASAVGFLNITGKRLGSATVSLSVLDAEDRVQAERDYRVVVLRDRTVVDDVFRYVLIVLGAVLYIGFGCKVKWELIKNILKKPIAPAVGQLSQFVVMPLIGFGLGQLLRMDTSLAFGVLVLACSPGGGASNVWVNLLDGDLDLSITMTALSTFVSLGAMPLWVYALGHFYLPPAEVAIPYASIARSILTIVIPVALGILIRHFSQRVADVVARFTRPFSGIFVVYVVGFGSYVNWYMYEIMAERPAEVIPSSILLPTLGYVCGFLLAVAARRSWREAVTVAVETGVQNASIPIIVLQGSFPQPEGDLAAVMPVTTSLFYSIPILIAWVAYVLYRRRHPMPPTDEELEAPLPDKVGYVSGEDNISFDQSLEVAK